MKEGGTGEGGGKKKQSERKAEKKRKIKSLSRKINFRVKLYEIHA